MTMRAWLAQAILLCAAVLLAACAASGNPPQQPVKDSGSPSSTDADTTVLGKLDLERDGKQMKIERMTVFGRSGTAALVIPEGANTALVLDMDDRGWFAWPLKPGTYSLLGFLTQEGNHSWFADMQAKFTVNGDEGILYIGHVQISSDQSRYSATLRDSEQAAIEEGKRRNAGAAAPVIRLAENTRIGTYDHVHSVCDRKWGAQCTRDVQGTAPIQPAITRGLHGSTFGKIETTTPTLKWQPAAMGVSYDVAIWEAATYRVPSKLVSNYIPGPLALYEENLVAPELALAKPLKPKTKYFWSVRLRDGDSVSSWSRAGHFTFMLVAWTSASGQWFAFETPSP